MRVSKNVIVFIETWVELLDTKVGAGKLQFGIDPLFNFIPGIGAFIPALFTLFLVIVGVVAKVPLKVTLLMTGYLAIDFLVSLVPFAGIPLDALFHDNAKSWALLKPYLNDTGRKNGPFADDTVILEGEVIK